MLSLTLVLGILCVCMFSCSLNINAERFLTALYLIVNAEISATEKIRRNHSHFTHLYIKLHDLFHLVNVKSRKKNTHTHAVWMNWSHCLVCNFMESHWILYTRNIFVHKCCCVVEYFSLNDLVHEIKSIKMHCKNLQLNLEQIELMFWEASYNFHFNSWICWDVDMI